MQKSCLHVGYQTPLAFTQGLQAHRLVEALKHAFALRHNFGDPGTCPPPADSAADTCFGDLTALLADMMSPEFAVTLRLATFCAFIIFQTGEHRLLALDKVLRLYVHAGL